MFLPLQSAPRCRRPWSRRPWSHPLRPTRRSNLFRIAQIGTVLGCPSPFQSGLEAYFNDFFASNYGFGYAESSTLLWVFGSIADASQI